VRRNQVAGFQAENEPSSTSSAAHRRLSALPRGRADVTPGGLRRFPRQSRRRSTSSADKPKRSRRPSIRPAISTLGSNGRLSPSNLFLGSEQHRSRYLRQRHRRPIPRSLAIAARRHRADAQNHAALLAHTTPLRVCTESLYARCYPLLQSSPFRHHFCPADRSCLAQVRWRLRANPWQFESEGEQEICPKGPLF
jgi:hypothetical protein